MISISNETAAGFLRRDLVKHLAEVIQLELNIPPLPTQAFADAEAPAVVMPVSEAPWGAGAFLSQHDDVFTMESVEYLSTLYGEFSLSSVDQAVSGAEAVTKVLGSVTVRCYPSLVCMSSDAAPPFSLRCRRLDCNDKDLFVHYPDERERAGESGSQFFERLVVGGEGEIFGIEEDGTLAGYLSCAKEIDHVWDVEFIHVLEDRRNRGLATELASAYAMERLGQGEIPYYSGPANQASERAAEKAGFTRCRTLLQAELRAKR